MRPDFSGHDVPAYHVGDLIDQVPALGDLAEIVPVDMGIQSSRAITPSDMHRLASRIDREVGNGCTGVIVTHGTDTMEETAYALALQLRLGVPVVMTGAMRLPLAPGADGPANLLSALQVAITPLAATLGPVVVMHDEVHLARWVTKVDTGRVAAFSSPGLGPVGSVIENRAHLFAHPLIDDYLGLPSHCEGRVELIWVAAGADGLLVDAAASRAQGIVIAGTGGGHVPPSMVASLQAAIEGGVVVILASRTGAGRVFEQTYGGRGSETHLLSLGAYAAGSLSPLKARLRLLVCLALGMKADDAFPV